MIVDIIAGSILLISMVIAFFRGIVREILTIAGFVCGVIGAIILGPVLDPAILDWLTSDTETPEKIFGIIPPDVFSAILAYGLSFFVITLAVSFITYLITKGLQASGLGPVNSLLGLVFGAIRGALLISLLYLPFYYNEDEDGYDWMTEAYSAKYVRASSALLDRHVIDRLLPEDRADALEENIEELDRSLDEPDFQSEDGLIESEKLIEGY